MEFLDDSGVFKMQVEVSPVALKVLVEPVQTVLYN
jgi:hypothetical protein